MKNVLKRLAPILLPLLFLLGVASIGGCRRSAEVNVEHAYKYHCPMHPQVVSDKPGTCPICGMTLVQRTGETAKGGAASSAMTDETTAAFAGPKGFAPITLDPVRRQLIGVKTAKVTRGSLTTSIETTGRVAVDETRLHHVHTKFEGYIEHVYVNFTGAFVKKGEPLVAIYSPELLATQEEYLLALKNRGVLASSGLPGGEKSGDELVEAARRRLLLWDIQSTDLQEIEKSGVPSRTLKLYAPLSGFVLMKNAIHGMRVGPGDSLFDIADLTHVWVLADVYEAELPNVKLGQPATVTLAYWPGRTWRGRIDYIFPTVDEKTRTVKVRVELDNPHLDLKPEMFANVSLSRSSRPALLLPEDAVLDSGTKKVVFVSVSDGRLEPREVTTGGRGKGVVEVLTGLEEGESVATGANFLVDSESRLQAALSSASPGASLDEGMAGMPGMPGMSATPAPKEPKR